MQVVAVCDVDTTRREHSKKTVEDFYAKKNTAGYKGCAVYNDFRELLARKDIDAVCIATPDHWHAIPVIEACKAKKDIYCEKPLTLTIAEARAMIDAVRKTRARLPDRQPAALVERVPQGVRTRPQRPDRQGAGRSTSAVGSPSQCRATCRRRSAEPGLDWDRWLGPAPERAYNSVLSPRGVHKHFPAWRNYREYSGGMMTDWGAHHFDIAQWGLGMDDSGPVEIIPPDGKDVKQLYLQIRQRGGDVSRRLEGL